jgi:hypothetical protein
VKWKILGSNLNIFQTSHFEYCLSFALKILRLKTLMGTNTTKPYKIQEVNGVGRLGITASDLKDLKKQAVKRLNISDDFEPHLDDDTKVSTEEYFQRLPPQTCFTFRAPYKDKLEMGRFNQSY